MDIKEFRSKVLSSPDKEWLQSVNVTFSYPYINFSQEFVGITAIYEFLQQQIRGRSKYENLPDQFSQSKQHFYDILQQIINLIQRDSLKGNWGNIESQISRTNHFPFIYNAPETIFLIGIYKANAKYFEGAYDCITKGGYDSISLKNKGYFFGYILAYEFFLKENALTTRREKEKKSMSQLRNDFQQYLNESEKQLLDHLASADSQFTEYVKKIDDLKTEKNDIFNGWYDTIVTNFNQFNDNSIEKISELENVYRDKLKFEEPAKYREKRGNALKKQGNRLLLILVLLILLAVLSLYKLLRSTPEEIFEKMLSNRDKLSIIRWSIIYITLISFIAFGIKYVAKAMFSAYHLARDAEERYTLTYLYLSLLKDNSVTDSERNLVMQSLFSRAETGLLKEDGSPTMPYDKIIDRVIPK